MSRLFLDSEFTGLTRDAKLLALALVADDESWFYAEFTDVDRSVLSDWHQVNVVPHLSLTEEQIAGLPAGGRTVRGPAAVVTAALLEWLDRFSAIEIWADVPAYDWVLFCDLFGGALRLPRPIHYIVRDLATLLVARGMDPDLSRFDLAYAREQRSLSSDGREPATEPDPTDASTGLMRHNALGDAMAGMVCLTKLLPA